MRHGRRGTARRLALALLLATGCGDGTGPAAPRRVVVPGLLERGELIVPRLVTSGGDTLRGVTTLRVTPTTGATLFAGDSLRWTTTGTVTLRVIVGADSADTTVTIASPPRIVFDAIRAGAQDIWSVALDGGDLVKLTTDPTQAREPVVANGTLFFISSRTGSAQIFKQPIAGGSAVLATVAVGAKSRPAVSFNAQRLAWSADTGAGTGARIWSADGTGAGFARFAPAEVGLAAGYEFRPAVHPSGDRIAYVTTRDGGLGSIWLGLLGGGVGSANRLVATTADSGRVEPSWNPAGTRLMYTTVSTRTDTTSLLIRDIATGATTVAVARRPGLSGIWVDENRIVFTEVVSGSSQLRYVDLRRPTRILPINVGGPASNPAAIR